MTQFTHLHVHTNYSILDGQASVKKIVSRAKELGMEALAITDHGSMYGVFEFYTECKKQGIKPIIGCEVYITSGSRHSKSSREDRSGYHLILLAKNKLGYENLSKLVSIGHTEGFYYTPRIDFEILEKYSEGLIASSACLGGEIPQEIMRKNNALDINDENIEIDSAIEICHKYTNIFGDDFYLELQDHGRPEQHYVNKALIRVSEKTGIPLVATNDTHFVRKEDYEAHTVLICLNTNRDIDDVDGMHYTGNEYLRSPKEMYELFYHVPAALENTQQIAQKVEEFPLRRDVALPNFEIPEGFSDQQQYLEHITWEGAKERWDECSDEIKERLNFELETIKRMGFPGYFLIVWDFIKKAREMGVRVGPGRGSAAGSAVAYAIGITGVDPIKYQLLFERFLNPERISMPDVDIDFDDINRDKVLEYVIDKYGREKVAQIVTFGTMGAKSVIRDVSRILKVPLQEADRLAKLVPDGQQKLENVIKEVPDLKFEYDSKPEIKKMLDLALSLEGTVRSTGVHACGVIIAPDELTKFVPIARAKDSEIPVTQFEGNIVEGVGLLKMDFLGLKTLSIINDSLENIKKRHNIDVDIDNIGLNDQETFDIFAKGNTTAIFQFESEGMKKHLQELKPTKFEDIIAMSALYRPGPMKYIPDFINRKHGKETIKYDLPEMEDVLKDTYGITVYQEQVMILSQRLANFTRGEADTLRKAIGKKLIDTMNEMKSKFVEGCQSNNIDTVKAEKIWHDWEAFAEYAFNKSHSTCYSLIAYQTAYLKAHYKAEFMAANLTNNLGKIDEISKLIDDCRRNGIEVLGPDVIESEMKFTVNNNGQIRFGLAAIKGVGEAAVENIVQERNENGPFTGIIDFLTRVNLRSCNKRCIESLAKAGAFDSFEEIHRAQFFHTEDNDTNFLEKLIRYAGNLNENKNSQQISLFDLGDEEDAMPEIEFPKCNKWSNIVQLKHEQDVTGFYISGHPLDDYKLAIRFFSRFRIPHIKHAMATRRNIIGNVSGIITSTQHLLSSKGTNYGRFELEDYDDKIEFTLFGNDYQNVKNFLEEGKIVSVNFSVVSPPRWKLENNPTAEHEVKVESIELLSELVDKKCKIIEIDIHSDSVNIDLIKWYNALFKRHNGPHSVLFNLVNKEKEYHIVLKSNNYSVNAVSLGEELDKNNISFKLK